jgi:hypothetical protein
MNPVELLSKSPAPQYDTVQVTISLGDDKCTSLDCQYWYVSVYTTGPNGNNPVYSQFQYTGWCNYTGPVDYYGDPTATKICVAWHFVSNGTSCDQVLQDKICCVPFTGSGHYTITCNPCDQ